MLSIPMDVARHGAAHVIDAHRHEDSPQRLVLHGQDEALDHGDAAVLPDRAEARPDVVRSAPRAERVAELWSLVGHGVLRSPAGFGDNAFESRAHLLGAGLLAKDLEADDIAREAIEHREHPPREGPSLHEAAGEHRDPEAGGGGHHGQIEIPHVMRVTCGDGATGRAGGARARLRGLVCRRLVVEHAPRRGGAQMQSGAGKGIRDTAASQGRTKRLEPADDRANQVGEAVDGLEELHERGFALLIQALHPLGDRRGSQQESLCGPESGPSSRGLELEDRHAFGGRVVRALSRRDAGHASVLDAQLFAQQRELGLEAIVVGRETNASDAAVGAPSAGDGDSEVREADRVEDSGPRVLVPAGGKGDVGRIWGHAWREKVALWRSAVNVRDGPPEPMQPASCGLSRLRELAVGFPAWSAERGSPRQKRPTRTRRRSIQL